MVSTGLLETTEGACAFNEPVRKKPLVLLAVRQIHVFSVHVPVLVGLPVEILSESNMDWIFCSRVVVEPYVVGFE